MIGILMLLGVGVVVSAFAFGNDGDDAAGDGASGADTYGDGDDEIISTDYRDGADAYFADLVSEGEITQDDYDSIVEQSYVDGALNVEMGGGTDSVLGSTGADQIDMGAGDDFAAGGQGDDLIKLGEGDDVSGFAYGVLETGDDFVTFPDNFQLYGGEREYEGGDDTILGGAGSDMIADNYGSNDINGQQGNDFISTVDQDGLTPDVVRGGHGDDVLQVDQGDMVFTSIGNDLVTVDVFGGVSSAYQVVTVHDFDPETDMIELEGSTALLLTPEPDGPDDVVENPITVADTEDGSGAVISVGGVPVVMVFGGQGMSVSSILIST